MKNPQKAFSVCSGTVSWKKTILSVQPGRCGTPKSEYYILDTHAWVWLLKGDNRIKKAAFFKNVIKASRVSGLYLSAISVWELAMLESKRRIVFSAEIGAWIEQALQAPGLSLVPLLPAISIDSTRLPGTFHGDPADRIIVATARHLQCPLITADKEICNYASQGAVRAVRI
ncbi:MAG: PIN domain-containing protein [Chitinivibrionales bacterium]|nr:PIN domain-containing protein [Chitinivibrionales bacterium]